MSTAILITISFILSVVAVAATIFVNFAVTKTLNISSSIILTPSTVISAIMYLLSNNIYVFVCPITFAMLTIIIGLYLAYLNR